MSDENLPKSDAIFPGLPPSPIRHGDEAFAAGPSPPSIAHFEGAEPTRICRCGSIMTVFLRENVTVNGVIPSGQRIYFRCHSCGKQIKVRSLWRLCLLAVGCCFFALISWILFPFDDWRLLIFVLLLAIYPLFLVSEFVTRMRYFRAGSSPWVRGFLWTAAAAGLSVLTLKLAVEIAPRLTTGDAALAAMTAPERDFHDNRFARLQIGMNRQQVLALLGPPDQQELLMFKLTWNPPGHQQHRESKLVVHFDPRTFHVSRATWLCRDGFFGGFLCELKP